MRQVRAVSCKQLVRILHQTGVAFDANWFACLRVDAIKHVALNPAISPPMHTSVAVDPDTPINSPRGLRRRLRNGRLRRPQTKQSGRYYNSYVAHFGEFIH